MRMTIDELELFIAAWGAEPDQWFVAEANYRTGEYGLSRKPWSSIERRATLPELRYPDDRRPHRFYVGDLVLT